MMSILRKLISGLWHVIQEIMAVTMVIMIILVFINVVLRYGFDSGILVTAEISRFLFVWFTMSGAAGLPQTAFTEFLPFEYLRRD